MKKASQKFPAKLRNALIELLECGLINQAQATKHTGGPILYTEEFLSLYPRLSAEAWNAMFPLIDQDHYARTYNVTDPELQLLDFLTAGPMKRLWPHPLIRFDFAAALRPDLAEDLKSAEETFRLISDGSIAISPWLSLDPKVALAQLEEQQICPSLADWVDPDFLRHRQGDATRDDWSALLWFASVEDAQFKTPSERFDPLVWNEHLARTSPGAVRPFLDFLWRGRIQGFPSVLPMASSVATPGETVLSYDAIPWFKDSRFLRDKTDENVLTFPKPDASVPKVAVVLHAFYLDTAFEILEQLQQSDASMRLYVTTIPENLEPLKEHLAKSDLIHDIFAFENRGRDIAPFLQVLPQVISDGNEYLLKLHTKKSLHRADGKAWATHLVDSLASKEALHQGLQTLTENPEIGFLGPEGHVLPLKQYMGPNASKVSQLIRGLGLSLRQCRDQGYFIAGSMFLARVAALEPILNLNLTPDDFEEEEGQLDGALPHAIERIVAVSGWCVDQKLMIMGNGLDNQLESQVFYPT